MLSTKKRKINFSQAINEALDQSMTKNKKTLCFGLGIDDPKRIFGTTIGLKEKFGNHRVFDMPTSENAMTGVAIGATLNGYSSIMVHQRLDFILLAMDQIINNAAKWHYMFGGQKSVSLTIRLIVGRGWGQGPTHSQSLQAIFSHIPGLKVVMPTTAYDAKGLLISSINDKNPVIFIEHRWLHNQIGFVPKKYYEVPLGSANLIRKGKDVTLISMSYMAVETIIAADFVKDRNINCDVLDLRTVSPIDYKLIYKSVKKTGKVVVIDTSNGNVSISSEIISRLSVDMFKFLKSPPIKIALPDVPVPSSFGLTKNFYPDRKKIVKAILKITNKKIKDLDKLKFPKFHDTPGQWFSGPF